MFLSTLFPNSQVPNMLQDNDFYVTYSLFQLPWSRGSVLAFGTQVRRFNPGRSRRIFKGEKILSTPSFPSEGK